MWELIKKWRYAGAELTTTERREMLEELFVFGKDNQLPFYKRMAFLLVISTIIACSGLLADSSAVVIGAMLVAPMMRPVTISAAAITLGWSHYLYQALLLVLIMAIGAVGIAAVLALVAPDQLNISEQVLARTKPTYFDLVIALAAGAGGAYTLTHKESNAIPGVAMAVALLPPLASTGILLVFGASDLALKAFVLFFTNFVAMVLSGTLTFLYLGVSPRKARIRSASLIRNYLLVFMVLVFGVSVPLYFYSTEVWYDARYKANQSEIMRAWLKENDFLIDDVRLDEKRRILFLKLLGPNPPRSVETLHTELESRLRIKHGENFKPFSIEVLWTKTASFGWPPELSLQSDKLGLERDYSARLRVHPWRWIGIQYANGDWLKPVHRQSYVLEAIDEGSIKISTYCTSGTAKYELSQEVISLDLDIALDEKCTAAKVDKRFISDLNQVIGINIGDEQLSLRLDSDIGVIYFEPVRQ
jgi:uncharacterized hydrophobic protein (TIGR00271 family)